MAYPIWITPAGNLGIIPENNFYQFMLDAYNPGGGTVTYKKISGQLPPGLQITKTGTLQGVPIVVGSSSPVNRTYEFGIRITNDEGKIADQSFTITISNIIPVQIVTKTTNLGNYFDGSVLEYDGNWYSVQLYSTKVDPASEITWTIVAGNLPNSITLSSSGLLSGYIYPLPLEGDAGLTGYSNAPYNDFGYDHVGLYKDQFYTFTIQATDGNTTDEYTYVLKVTSKKSWTADNDIDVVSDDFLTIDHDNSYTPFLITPFEPLPNGRGDSNFAFKFDAIDPEYDEISFKVTTAGASGFDDPDSGFDTTGFDQQAQELPPGLSIDSHTGWLSGHIPAQAENIKTYDFIVQAYKTYNPDYISLPRTFSLTILGDINNTIEWTTPTDLGVINNGDISELSVSAVSSLGKQLVYSLAPLSEQTRFGYSVTNSGVTSRLPQGLELLSSGLLIGRVSFEYFALDSGRTTIDGGNTTFDSVRTFTIKAESTDGSVSSTKTFTVRVNNFNIEPYENLYLKALPSIDQRQTFLDIINNQDIFPNELIYRPTDPWFGRCRDIRSLFLPGLSASEVTDYANALATNHFNKRIEFGDIRTARAVDSNFNTKYEVVYVPLIDNEVNEKGQSPANVNHVNYLNYSGDIYPNSFKNMSSVVATAIGYSNPGALPDWMTSPQTNQTVIGFTNCIVLAYTVPGASSLIAYRLKSNGITFNNIDFVADRYDLDNALSKNYNLTTRSFVYGRETTFNRIVRVGTIGYTVDYAVSRIPFNQINNQSVASIRALGGLDGVTNFSDGQTLVFAQQEGFVNNPSPNDGWINIDGSIVPGYKEHLYSSVYPNLRGGVWQININNLGIVTLTPVATIEVGTQIQVNLGRTHASSIMFYDQTLAPNQTVPKYSTVTLNTIPKETVFDGGKTKFIGNRDTYQAPQTSDVYLKFPKINSLQ